LVKNISLQIPLVDAIKMLPYSKYMNGIVSNLRKIPAEAINTMLADYSFERKSPEKHGDPGVPTIQCSVNILMSDMLYVI
jgi:hypothetical protein